MIVFLFILNTGNRCEILKFNVHTIKLMDAKDFAVKYCRSVKINISF